MALTIFFIGMLVFFISIIFFIVRLVTKKSKKPVAISILVGFIIMIVGFIASEPEEDTTKEVAGITKQKDKSQNEVEKETINTAVKGNFVELNSGEFPKDKVFYINGKITDIIKDGSLGRFYLNISDVYGGGILLVDNFSGTSSLKNGDDVTIYGVYKGSDEETSIPVMSATIIKVYEEDDKVYGSAKDDIEEKVKDITRNFDSTSVEKIKLNENMATDNPNDYIVLVYLSFNIENSKKTTRDMINMYNNELGVQLADVSEVGELTIFWEVPYHLEDENSAKANLKRNGDNMFFEEEWYAPVLQ